jgi:hypothetical protein
MDRSRSGSFVAAVVAVLTCAVCPVCLSVYASVLSVFGVGFALSERTHGWLLIGSLSFALAISIWAATRHQRIWPPLLTALGGAALLFSHFTADHIVIDLFGTSLVFTANVWGGRLRRHDHQLIGLRASASRARVDGHPDCDCGSHHS